MRRPAPWLALLLAVGCAHGLRQRAESAFRNHNAVSTELMLLLPALEDEAWIVRLEGSEARMNAACAALDALVAARRDGRSADPGIRREAVSNLARCECETEAMSRLLLDPRAPDHPCGEAP